MIPFGLASLMAVSLPIARRTTKCLVPGASAIYLCNEGTGTTLTDYSGNAANGAFGAGAAAPSWDAKGIVNGADDYTTCPNILNTAAPFSVVAAHTPATVTGFHAIASKLTGAGQEYGWVLYTSGTELRFLTMHPTSGIATSSAAGAVAIGTPNIATGVFTGSEAYLYSGATKVAEDLTAAFSPATAQNLTIGAYSYTGTINYAGGIHAVVIYPFALSPAQVTQTYTALKGILAPRGVAIA